MTLLTTKKGDGYGYFAVILKESNHLIGQVGIMKSDINGEEAVEIGYIFDNSVWGQGYCMEAAKTCIELAFHNFEVKKLYCTVRPENESSIKVAKKLGMVEVGKYVKTYNKKEMIHLIFVLEN